MMNCTLISHEKGYHLSIKDGLWSTITGFSGFPYAERHAALSKNTESRFRLGHEILYLLESLPVVGALTAIVERIVVVAYTALFGYPKDLSKGKIDHKYEKQLDSDQTLPIKEAVNPNLMSQIDSSVVDSPSLNPTVPSEKLDSKKPEVEVAKPSLKVSKPTAWLSRRGLPLDTIMKKMWKNAKKAIEEHRAKNLAKNKDTRGYATVEEGIPSLESILNPLELSKPLSFTYNVTGLQGVRSTMEDAHFFKQMPQGVLAGIFDGHGGKEVANYANLQFQKRFPMKLKSCSGNVHQAFELLIHEIHTEAIKNKRWDKKGTTAIVCFIDEKTGLIYTATLGDSEANIYRDIKGTIKSIPLSVVRDWSNPKEAARIAIHWDKPDIISGWSESNPKKLRSHLKAGLNVSRSLGDKEFIGTDAKPLVIHKPKISVNRVIVNPTETSTYKIILACDGLRDYVSESEIIEQIQLYNAMKTKEKSLSTHLAEFAINEKGSEDNVSVLVIDVQ